MTHTNPLRRLVPITLIALVAGGALGGIAVADNGAPHQPSDSHGRAEVLRFYGHANLDAEVYVRANGTPPPTSAITAPFRSPQPFSLPCPRRGMYRTTLHHFPCYYCSGYQALPHLSPLCVVKFTRWDRPAAWPG